jgi:hypothetical protein
VIPEDAPSRIAGRQGANTMNGRPIAFALLLALASALAVADAGGPAGPAPRYETIVGCLERSPTGDFVVRSEAAQITLREAGGMDKHLGRTVRVTGRWQDDETGHRLRVAKIEYVAEGCG